MQWGPMFAMLYQHSSLMSNLMDGKNAQGPWEVPPSNECSLRPVTLTELCENTATGQGMKFSPTPERSNFFSSAYTHTGNGRFWTKTGTALKTHRHVHWTSAPSTVNILGYVLLPPHHPPKWPHLTKVLLWSTAITGKIDPVEPADRKTVQIFLFSSCGYDNWVFSLLVCCIYPSLVCLKTRINFMILI